MISPDTADRRRHGGDPERQRLQNRERHSSARDGSTATSNAASVG
jgi:hypothetical protein